MRRSLIFLLLAGVAVGGWLLCRTLLTQDAEEEAHHERKVDDAALPTLQELSARKKPDDKPKPQKNNAAQATKEGSTKPTAEKQETDPVAFLEKCLEKYQSEVKGYTCVLKKQEVIAGELQKPEEIEVAYRETPHSVYMDWKKGARKAKRVLWVEGKNDGKLLARAAGLAALLPKIWEIELDSKDAKKAGRYPVSEVGLKQAVLQTIKSWKAARAAGHLDVRYQGVFEVEEADKRPCYKLWRTNFAKPEEEGVTDLTVYIDKETLFQVGAVLKDKDGKLIGSYFFRDIKVNPEFKKNQFTREGLSN